jgi:UDP-N-acetylmuramyl pentapeptide phosphotransferase/UDP-N-acetylglucosamine-1-phosphate transferase
MSAIAAAASVAFAVAFLTTPLLRRLALRTGRLDVPGEAISHDRPTPRNGGYAIVAGITVGTLACSTTVPPLALLVSALLVGIAAAVDEFRSLPRVLRLCIQIGLATLAVLWTQAVPRAIELPFGSLLRLGVLAAPLAVIWLVGSINAFNFMDGLNGLASSAAVISCTTLAILALRQGDTSAALVSAAVAGAAAGFIPWNLLSGSIFMGDVGSATLGFIIGLLVLRLSASGVPFLAAALPFLCFIADAFVAVLRRALRGERFFATRHRSHFYQMLNQQGWSHAAVTGLFSLLLAAAAVAAVAYDDLTALNQMLALGGIVLLETLMFVWISARHGARRTM